MKRVTVIVGKDQVKSRFGKSASAAIARAIADHHKNGRDTYCIWNGKIAARKPDGRIVLVE